MGKPAIIVESPTKTRTLKRFLGNEYILLASMGHVRDLPQDDLAVDVENDFAPSYEIIPRQRKTISSLRKKLEKVDTVYLASDPDREGEAIARDLAEALKIEHPLRIEFNEITEQAVREALANPGQINVNRVNAQQARRILDRLVGYKLSPLLWNKVGSGRARRAPLSAGRVQSVALRLICDREREVAAFVPEEYWSIDLTLSPQGSDETFIAELKTKDGEEVELQTEAQVTPVVAELRELPYVVAAVQRKETRRKPPPPFITSTLQRQAASQLRFSARNTMRIAQQLYEGVNISEETVGLITYMRTDSTRIAAQARQQVKAFISQNYGENYVGPGSKGKKVKAAQEAHEAIRPTDVQRTPDKVQPFLSEEQAKLYELIWRRLVASQMAPAVYDQTGVDITAGPYGLRASASVLKFPGYQAVTPPKPSEDKNPHLPHLEPEQSLDCHDVVPEQHFTKPPPRFNEGTLVAALEENGIGRPSTYAPIIETLRQRKYVRMQQRAFIPTPLGFAVCDYLVDNFPRIMEVEFTAHVEADLDTVENGELDWVALLSDFYRDFEGLLEQANEAPLKVLEGEVCPECGGKLLQRYSIFGKFAGCENYPDCKYTKDLVPETARAEPPEELDETCPECGKKLVVRVGRQGRKFIACSGFPQCRYTRPLQGDQAPQQRSRTKAIKTDIPCKECGNPLVLRSGRRGPFLGCSGYPKCRFTRDATKEELERFKPDDSSTPEETG